MKREGTVNTFEGGLQMDTSALVTPKNVLTNCLNGTLVTFNGNENVLQNDMGNGRVETAELPSGYIPLGTTELGGIIYVVSYNPQNGRCQFGSFPSPERNFSSYEFPNTTQSLDDSDFIQDSAKYSYTIGENTFKKEVKSFIIQKKISGNEMTLSPGDKFIVRGNSISQNYEKLTVINKDGTIKYGNLDLKIATVDSNGRIVYLNDLLLRENTAKNTDGTYITDKESGETITFKHIIEDGKFNSEVEENNVKNKYNIFTSKIAGELFIVGELEIVDSMTTTWQFKEMNGDNGVIKINCSCPAKNKDIKFAGILVYDESKTGNKCTFFGENTEGVSLTYNEDDASFQVEFNYTINSNEIINLEFVPVMEYGFVPQYKQVITIDPSLFGKDVLSSSLWRYYKNSDSMQLVFGLDCYLKEKEQATDLNLYFIPYTDILNKTEQEIKDNITNYSYIQTPKRKSYSGNYSPTVQFGEIIEENSLYLVAFQLTVKDENDNISYKYLYHCLYTNGVFNKDFLNDITNFDENTLNFEYQSDLGNNDQNLSIVADKDDSLNTQFINSKSTIIKGNTITNISGTIDLKPTLKLENNFNTFNLNNYSIQVNSIGNTYISKTFDKVNTSSNNFDKDNFMDLEKVKQSPEELNGEKLEISLQNKTLTINGNFNNKICANTEIKRVTYNNYYQPMITSKDDVLRYGLINDDNEDYLKFNQDKFIALGMSNGGQDNTGGGNVYHVKGTVELHYDNDTKQLYYSNNYTEETNSDGSKGINSFPNEDFDSLINTYYNGALFVPVIMVNANANAFYLDSVKDSNKRIFDDSSVDGNRLSRFKKPQNSTFKTIWLFVRQSDNTYIPLNQFIQIKDLKLNMWPISGKSSTEQVMSKVTLPQLLGSLLMQLYVKKTDQETSNTNTVKDIMYYDNLSNLIEINYNYSLNTDGYISFISEKLSTLKESFTKYVTNTECFDYNNPEAKNGQDSIKIPVKNKDLWLETYLQYQSDVISIDNGVYSPFNKEITVNNNLLGTIFYVNNDSELKRVDDKFNSFKLVNTISFDDSGHIKSMEKESALIESTVSTGLSKFAQALDYDRYTQTSTIQQSKIIANTVQGIWASGGDPDSWKKTTWKDIYLFNELRPN